MKSIRKKKQQINTILPSINTIPTKKLDKEIMDRISTMIFERLKQYGMCQDNAGVMEHYQQLLYAIESLYKYIYTKTNSHLTSKDAKIFASYISDRVKKLKDIVENTH